MHKTGMLEHVGYVFPYRECCGVTKFQAKEAIDKEERKENEVFHKDRFSKKKRIGTKFS